jgi:uncharacterized membrane protein
MGILILGLVLFLGMHSVSIVMPAWRDRTAARFGQAWRVIYSLISLAGFVLIVWGYGLARHMPIVVYVPPAWTRHVAALLMLPVFPLLFASHMPGRIKTTLKHPMLAAVKFWALAHLIANGMLADIFLFGGFLAWAVVDRISYKYRVPRPIKMAPPSPYNDWIATVGGLAVYVLFVFWAHRILIGVSPF